LAIFDLLFWAANLNRKIIDMPVRLKGIIWYIANQSDFVWVYVVDDEYGAFKKI
jgi:hypothetical protein